VTIPERVAAAVADRYTILRELGRGGMATVYLAEDLDFNIPPIGRIYVKPVAGNEARELFTPGPGDPVAIALDWSPDGRIYFKAHHDAGRASFWYISPSGGAPRQLVRFDDLRPSSRADFAVDRSRFYFPIEDRQSDIYVVEVTSR
jgi:serine/threonine protein kinase